MIKETHFHNVHDCVSSVFIAILLTVQWSLYFKTTHVTKKMWSYIAGGLKIKVI